ncbi:MAG: UDP-N-acetylmuramate dehydrogenase [Dethiobacter sp.]|jgi:UDP-N-acetylmuramate dehydrogenase|nr:MAG: UDP-N-acetylmuramate dehydrogenase [Dethiobacter sp.]
MKKEGSIILKFGVFYKLDWQEKLDRILSKRFLKDEPMSLHTSLKIGGPADFLVFPQNRDELCRVLELAGEHNIPLFVLGQGTNLLVKDGGIRGIVISLADMCSSCDFSNHGFRAGAALPLWKLGWEAANKGLSGLEFTTGIPGSLGGAIYMNAGAYGTSISELIREVSTIDFAGNYLLRSREGLEFAYRWSTFQEEKVIILEGVLELVPGDKNEIMQRVKAIQEDRSAKHPHFPSAGSVFRNPPGKPAGFLIEQVNCKGMAAGGAQVSLQHGNFIINRGNATAGDVLTLMELVKQKVKDTFQVELEPEIRVIGENGGEQGRRKDGKVRY